jgi:hypothetical protein
MVATSDFRPLYSENNFRYHRESIIPSFMSKNLFKHEYHDGEIMAGVIYGISDAEKDEMYQKKRVIAVACLQSSLNATRAKSIIKVAKSNSEIALAIFKNSPVLEFYEKLVKPIYRSNYDYNMLKGYLEIIKDILDVQTKIIEHISCEVFVAAENRIRTEDNQKVHEFFLIYLMIES